MRPLSEGGVYSMKLETWIILPLISKKRIAFHKTCLMQESKNMEKGNKNEKK